MLFLRHKNLFEKSAKYDLSAIFQSRSLHDIVDSFLLKQSGYDTCNDYYKEASLDAKLDNIKVQTLFVNAADDMFSPLTGILIFFPT